MDVRTMTAEELAKHAHSEWARDGRSIDELARRAGLWERLGEMVRAHNGHDLMILYDEGDGFLIDHRAVAYEAQTLRAAVEAALQEPKR